MNRYEQVTPFEIGPGKHISGPGFDSEKTSATGKSLRALITGWIVFSLGIFTTTASMPKNFPDLTDMSLEDLMNIEITSVSKKPQKQASAAAAIFVITGDDLHRWGVTNIRRVASTAALPTNCWC